MKCVCRGRVRADPDTRGMKKHDCGTIKLDSQIQAADWLQAVLQFADPCIKGWAALLAIHLDESSESRGKLQETTRRVLGYLGGAHLEPNDGLPTAWATPSFTTQTLDSKGRVWTPALASLNWGSYTCDFISLMSPSSKLGSKFHLLCRLNTKLQCNTWTKLSGVQNSIITC